MKRPTRPRMRKAPGKSPTPHESTRSSSATRSTESRSPRSAPAKKPAASRAPSADSPDAPPAAPTTTPEAKVNTQLLDRLERRESGLRRVRRRRVLLASGIFVALAALLLVIFVSPLTAYRLAECRVMGAKHTDAAAICQATSGFEGIPLTRLSAGRLSQTVLREVPALKTLQMERRWWHGIILRVQEREPVATVRQNGKIVGVDRDTVVLEVAPGDVAGLPQLNVDLEKLGGKTSKLVAAALHTLGDMPPQLHSQIAAVTSQDPAQLSFSLRDGHELIWGNDQNADLKSKVALLLLEQPKVKVVDVSSPERPSTR